MKTTANAGHERFRSGAHKYAAYLETPEGRLRTDLAFANLQEFLSLPQLPRSLSALDLGCGTGAIAVRLARLGVHVTVLDSSSTMLDIASRTAREAGVAAKILVKQGDVAQLPNLFPTGSFDVILCHNILEYVDDPGAMLRAAAQVMADSTAILSVLVRNRAGEVLKSAIQKGDLAAAEDNLSAEWGRESLFGGRVRLFTADTLRASLSSASLELTTSRGVRVISDYLPPGISRTAEYGRILELERKLGSRPEFAGVARYLHYIARRRDSVLEDRS